MSTKIISLDELDRIVQQCRDTQPLIHGAQVLCTTLRKDGRITIEFETLTYFTDDFGETFHSTFESWNKWRYRMSGK